MFDCFHQSMKMKRRVGIFFILWTLYIVSVKCQNVYYVDSTHNYDLTKSIKIYSKDFHILEKMQLMSEWVKNYFNELQDFVSNFNIVIMFNMLSQTPSDKCHQDLQYAFRNLFPPAEWALKMVDSFGKPDSGVLLGNLRWLGQYDECLNVYAPNKGNTGVGDFHGQYCTLNIPINLRNLSLPLSMAVCLPDSCNADGFFNGFLKTVPEKIRLTALYKEIESIFDSITVTCDSTSKNLTAGSIFLICFLSVVVLLAVVGTSITILEYYLRAKEEKKRSCLPFKAKKTLTNGNTDKAFYDDNLRLRENSYLRLAANLEYCKPFFTCFCIVTNGKKIFNTDNQEGDIPCLHGVRVLSMTWVTAVHAYIIVALTIRNPLECLHHIDTWPFQIIANGFFSVDSFFVLSGFLVGYSYFQKAANTDGNIHLLSFYTRRYLRLTPVYMIVLAFFTTVTEFLGSGPLWLDYTVFQACKNRWWLNLLYINNFDDNANKCMGWSWYMATNVQFFVITPVLLITLWRSPKIGYSLFGLLFSITFTANFVLTYENNLVASFGNLVEDTKDLEHFFSRVNDTFNYTYIKPYTRIESYLVGILLAYYLHNRQEGNYAKLNRITLWIGWTLASCVTLTCQFGIYHQQLSRVAAAFYKALSRVSFSLGFSWVIFVCVIGQGDIVNSILSWKVWIPLSRLAFCTYLVHPIVQATYFLSTRTLIECNQLNIIILHLGYLLISLAAALVLSLLFETPINRIESLLRKKFYGKNN